jgi:hypothetical protein
LGQFIANLSAATGLNANRFVALNATVSASSPTVNVSAKLRPPFRTEQLSNSYVSFGFWVGNKVRKVGIKFLHNNRQCKH